MPVCQANMESESNTVSDCAGEGQQQARSSHGRTGGPTRRSTKGQWSAEEDEILRAAVQRFNGKNWKKIADCFKDRTDVQCLHRWQKVLNPDLVKGPWSKEEDEIIVEMVKRYGPKKWSAIAQHLPGRIGKQCRERWHNHLNPNINKQAWTQEEELALIRAHQVYGNKWAELTKYLPGRTDNAIKNHWNSSVKKKLDMYATSGLLSQFQGPPLVNHSAASSSSKPLQSRQDDDGDIKGKREMDELSESSKPSRNNRIAHPIVDRKAAEESSQFQYSQEYHNDSQQDTFSMSENFQEHDLSLDWATFAGKHWQLNSDEMLDLSLLDLGQESTDPFMPSLEGTDNYESVPVPIDTSVTLIASNSMTDMVMGIDASKYIDTGQDGCSNSQNANEDSLLYTNENYQLHEDANFASQSFCMPETSSNQPLPVSTQLAHDECRSREDPNQNTYTLENAQEGLVLDSIPCEDNSKDPTESPRMVSTNDFVLTPASDSQCVSFKGKTATELDEKMDSGALFYEPPRFSSLDVPFFSCDLVQSGSDMNQDYSPLGIRQLMISSSIMTPLKLWDSPSRDDDNSLEFVLRSAAKTFVGTPSILKKRSRDLVSPLSEKKGEKKQELSTLRNDSRLEAKFDECVDKKEGQPLLGENTKGNIDKHFTDKENMDPRQENGMTNEGIVISKTEGGIAEMKTGKECTQNLVENDNDVLFLSPVHFGIKSDRAFGLSASGNRYMDSPPAWKSPWLFSTFVPGPKVDTDITIEDIEFLMSPAGERSYDAIGLMKQLGEQTAGAFADAQEVLGDETPETIMKEKSFTNKKEAEKENCHAPNSNTDQLQIVSPAKLMTERRILNFSEFGTPVKHTEKTASSISHSSPCSCLLKNCR